MIDRVFFEHPRSVGESYGEHLRIASGFGLTMMGAGLACIVHGIVPSLFVKTGSAAIDHLHGRMVRNRGRVPTSASTGPAMAENELA